LVLNTAAQQAAPDRPFQEVTDEAKAAPPAEAPPAAPAADVPVVRGTEPVNTYGPQTVQFSDGVSAVFDLTYAILPGYRPLTLDLYSPRPGNAPLPLVVFVHGG